MALNALRNIFSARSLHCLRQNGQNALFNLNSQLGDNVNNISDSNDCVSTLPITSEGSNSATISNSSCANIRKESYLSSLSFVTVAKNLLQATSLRDTTIDGQPIFYSNSAKCPRPISPTTLRTYKRMQHKLTIIYRCKLCNTRNSKEVNASAYISGVVILQCDGCFVNHVISDKLGWFTNMKGKTFHDILKEKTNQRIHLIQTNQYDEIL